MDTQEQLYTDGFNNGYLLRKHMPDFLTTLFNNLTFSSEYTVGMKYGAVEYEQELTHDLSDIARLRNQQRDVDRDLLKD